MFVSGMTKLIKPLKRTQFSQSKMKGFRVFKDFEDFEDFWYPVNDQSLVIPEKKIAIEYGCDCDKCANFSYLLFFKYCSLF